MMFFLKLLGKNLETYRGGIMNIFLMKYLVKRAIREKSIIFWTVLFPLLLATIFGVALKNVDKGNNTLESINIMVESPIYREILSGIKYRDKNIYKIKEYKDPVEALKNGEIKAYINGGIIANSEEIQSKFSKFAIDTKISSEEKKKYISQKVSLKKFQEENNILSRGEEKYLDELYLGKKSIFINEMNLGSLNINILKNGEETDILKEILNSINQTSMAIGYIVDDKFETSGKKYKIQDKEVLDNNLANITLKNVFGEEKKNPNVIFFYALIAMICLGGITFGVTVVEDMSLDSEFKHVVRTSIAPISRKKIILNEMLVYVLFNTIVSILLYLYMKVFLKVPFAGNSMYVLLTIVISNIMAIFIGMFLAIVTKAKTSTKYSLAAACYVLSCFISGMMSVNVLGTLLNKMPIINYINPATVITRMLLSLYITDSSNMYWKLFINLCLLTIAAILATAFAYRFKVNKLKGKEVKNVSI